MKRVVCAHGGRPRRLRCGRGLTKKLEKVAAATSQNARRAALIDVETNSSNEPADEWADVDFDDYDQVEAAVAAILTPQEMRARLARILALADLQQRTPQIRLVEDYNPAWDRPWPPR